MCALHGLETVNCADQLTGNSAVHERLWNRCRRAGAGTKSAVRQWHAHQKLRHLLLIDCQVRSKAPVVVESYRSLQTHGMFLTLDLSPPRPAGPRWRVFPFHLGAVPLRKARRCIGRQHRLARRPQRSRRPRSSAVGRRSESSAFEFTDVCPSFSSRQAGRCINLLLYMHPTGVKHPTYITPDPT
jgi:hypothetical protein